MLCRRARQCMLHGSKNAKDLGMRIIMHAVVKPKAPSRSNIGQGQAHVGQQRAQMVNGIGKV